MWVVPHNLYLTVFAPSSVNVLVFDPRRGPDQARQYAAKYCSKPEPWYFLETEKNGLKDWLKARTVGLCMAFNRILHFHSTRPVQWQPAEFVPKKDSCVPRGPSHISKKTDYPDEQFFMNTCRCTFSGTRA